MNTSFLQKSYEGNRSASLKKEIIRLLVIGGNYSITDISKEMNTSVPTITKLIVELISEGYVLDFGKQGTNGGRRPNVYGLNPDAGYFAGVDISKDFISMGVINFKGEMTEFVGNREFVMENTIESLDSLCSIINSFLNKLSIPRDKILSLGVNLSGRVNSESGYSYSFYFLGEKPLSMLIEERVDCPVYIENDSRAMTYGEFMMGSDSHVKNMIFINASWGLGIGIIMDGRLYYGKSGFSGEYGHFPFFDNEIICRCGKRGCLETGVSGSAIHRMFTERLKEGRVSMLSGKFNNGLEITLEDIMDALQKEDVLAIEIIECVGNEMGKAISGLINLFNPELIVLGGTLAAAKEYIMLPIRSAINKYSLILVSKDTKLKLSRLGEKCGVTGACMLVRSKTLGLL
ncbi:MAG: ROK family transcriptional regulator [Bacteroidetes bacterium HGW-Bacteroidetes-8]|jgi:predicted NBD/HSP70 family sugar kinase|nr:MAG: ROK family transcriptional regulator [Bacteroidetes bacterium HGW-Bacteroidetes-8]